MDISQIREPLIIFLAVVIGIVGVMVIMINYSQFTDKIKLLVFEVERLKQQKITLKNEYDVLLQSITSIHKGLLHSEKLALLGRNLTDISNELNNPLNLISGSAQALIVLSQQIEDAHNTSEQAFQWKDIARELVHINNLIRGGISRALITTGSIKALVGQYDNVYSEASTDVRNCVESAIALFTVSIRQHGILINKQFQIVTLINANESLLTLAFANLLEHTISILRNCSGYPILAIQVLEDPAAVKILIVCSEIKKQIRNNFSKSRSIPSDEATKKFAEGRLAIVNVIIAQHHGKFSINSNQADSHQYIISLPK